MDFRNFSPLTMILNILHFKLYKVPIIWVIGFSVLHIVSIAQSDVENNGDLPQKNRAGIHRNNSVESEDKRVQNIQIKPIDRETWKKEIQGLDYADEIQEEELQAEDFQLPPEKIRQFWASVFKIFILVLLVLGVCIILIKVVGRNLFLFDRKSKVAEETAYKSLMEIERNLPDSTIDPAFAEAVENGNFRLALRFKYLELIQLLNREGFIKWSPEKTSQQYISEIRQMNMVAPFMRLNQIFETIWFGNYPLEKSNFAAILSQMEAFSIYIKERSLQDQLFPG